MTDVPDVKVRLYIGGEMVDEAQFPFGNPEGLLEELAERHARWVLNSTEPYMVEFVFADGQHVRWGTDPAGMLDPHSVALEDLGEALYRQIADYEEAP